MGPLHTKVRRGEGRLHFDPRSATLGSCRATGRRLPRPDQQRRSRCACRTCGTGRPSAPGKGALFADRAPHRWRSPREQRAHPLGERRALMLTMDHILVEPARADPNAVPVRAPVRGWRPLALLRLRGAKRQPRLSAALLWPLRRRSDGTGAPARRTGVSKVSQPLLWSSLNHRIWCIRSCRIVTMPMSPFERRRQYTKCRAWRK